MGVVEVIYTQIVTSAMIPLRRIILWVTCASVMASCASPEEKAAKRERALTSNTLDSVWAEMVSTAWLGIKLALRNPCNGVVGADPHSCPVAVEWTFRSSDPYTLTALSGWIFEDSSRNAHRYVRVNGRIVFPPMYTFSREHVVEVEGSLLLRANWDSENKRWRLAECADTKRERVTHDLDRMTDVDGSLLASPGRSASDCGIEDRGFLTALSRNGSYLAKATADRKDRIALREMCSGYAYGGSNSSAILLSRQQSPDVYDAYNRCLERNQLAAP